MVQKSLSLQVVAGRRDDVQRAAPSRAINFGSRDLPPPDRDLARRALDGAEHHNCQLIASGGGNRPTGSMTTARVLSADFVALGLMLGSRARKQYRTRWLSIASLARGNALANSIIATRSPPTANIDDNRAQFG